MDRRNLEHVTEDPLWTLTPVSEEPPQLDVAEIYIEETPENLQVYTQTNGFLNEYFPAQESSSNSVNIPTQDSLFLHEYFQTQESSSNSVEMATQYRDAITRKQLI